jgi:hypothetical protein
MYYADPDDRHALAFQQSAKRKKDSTHTLKNTIHFNLTNPMIFGNGSIILGYIK